MTALFSGAALMNAAMAVASAVGTIAAGDRLGERWGAVPNTAGIVGTGIGALVLTAVMGRHGRKAGLNCGYLASAGGGALAAAAVTDTAAGDMGLLSAGMLLLGLGNAGAQLSRYAAADLYPAERRGFAIGTVVWAGAIGAVGGPLLLGPSGTVAGALGATPLTGPYVLATVAALGAAAALATVRRDPPDSAGAGRTPRDGPDATAASGGVTGTAVLDRASGKTRLRSVARASGARTALAVMVVAQMVMVAVMTAVPLDMHMHGQGLGAVGTTLAAHTFGMFAFSPVTGWLLDRAGARLVMSGGLLTLVAATALAASGGGAPLRTGALFLLGYGWNLCFVGGSGQLARGLPSSARASVEGAVDAAVWSIAAAASLASTLLLSAGGYAALGWAACALIAVPAVLLLRAG
ncbi:MFS transporter [Actinomadura sp. DC4]|uniref:MFS transporter n=1 Tax=Actinomadura sp. DC4 TaxID=3055069 RepID=UPI0025B18060|nr:MFS transporter [Actinomadura sp. DC4]MDN3352556.1 MFS transporter [Actinomadura sp. DC4]